MLCERIIHETSADYHPTYVVLDHADYAEQPELLTEFRDLAFAWKRNDPIERTPHYLRLLMNETSCDSLIWLSHRALGFDDRLFTWLLVHELRHVYQFRIGYQTSNVRAAVANLRRKSEFLTLPATLFAPTEMDSELYAYRYCRRSFEDGDGFTQFQRNTALPRCPGEPYWRFLSELDAAMP